MDSKTGCTILVPKREWLELLEGVRNDLRMSSHCRVKKEEVQRNTILGGVWHVLLDQALPEAHIILDFPDSEPINRSLYYLSGFSVHWNIMINYISLRIIPHLL